jgi:hypothetical protein
MSDGLGSLAQSVRRKGLKSTKATIIAIGVLTAVANFALAGMTDVAAARYVQKLHKEGKIVDPRRVDVAKRTTRLISIGFGVLGVVFIVMGIFVETFPVPITILALVMFLAGWAATVVMAPPSSAVTRVTSVGTIVVKIIIAVGLARSIQTAIAYERDRAAPFKGRRRPAVSLKELTESRDG